MPTFQEIGASLDAANREASAALDCSTKVPPDGFQIGLNYVMPEVLPAGYDRTFISHPGMKPLMERMVNILRRDEFDFQHLINAAVRDLQFELTNNADQFTAILNEGRAAAGLAPLASAELDGQPAVLLSEVEARVTAAVNEALQAHVAAERGRTENAVKHALEAYQAEQDAAEAPEADDPAPPRGAPNRRKAR